MCGAVCLIGSCFVLVLVCLSTAASSNLKLKVCVVDGRGGFARAAKTCPVLDKPDSPVECIVGVDRLDCLRKISKGLADFSVFTPEDLVTATNTEVEVSLTNELRFTTDAFEYEVVAVVDDGSGINSRHDLRDKRLCHPGYGYEVDWSKILANYLEASVVPQTCDPKLTLTENRIKASSEFFRSACKAGPWVTNQILDIQLKRKYPNLCQLCDHQARCSAEDKYWGRRGPLLCLTDGAGDIAWARLDDVKVHFGLVPGGKEANAHGYSLICPDGTKMPVNSTDHCVWVVKPWSVIGARRNRAEEVQNMMSVLKTDRTTSWKVALLDLIESYRMSIDKIQPADAIENYLERATGFLNANSFSGCHPPRTIHICTTSVIENFKCVWLRESAAAYGIEPDLDCIKADNTTHCMQALNDMAADVVMVPPDLINTAIKYNLKTLFYETVNDTYKYVTVPVTKKNSGINNFHDMRGKSACFPVYDGIAWNSVVSELNHKKLLSTCPFSSGMTEFFGPSCVPNITMQGPHKLKEKCAGPMFEGDYGAIRCLLQGNGDVAFVSQNSLHQFFKDPDENKMDRWNMDEFKIICEDPKSCHLSWSPIAQAMVRSNSTDLWFKDTLNVFFQLDSLFGKHYKSLTLPYSLFGPFNGKSDVLFHDVTERFNSIPRSRVIDDMSDEYEIVLKNNTLCITSLGAVYSPYSLVALCIISLVSMVATRYN